MTNFSKDNIDRLLFAINDLYGVDYHFNDFAESFNRVLEYVTGDKRAEFEKELADLIYSVQLSSLKVGAVVVQGILYSANSPPATETVPIDAADV